MQNMRVTYRTAHRTQSCQVTVTKKAASGARWTRKKGIAETQSVRSRARRTAAPAGSGGRVAVAVMGAGRRLPTTTATA